MCRDFEQGLNAHLLTGKETKAVRAKIEKQYPNIKDYLDEIWPKKEQVL